MTSKDHGRPAAFAGRPSCFARAYGGSTIAGGKRQMTDIVGLATSSERKRIARAIMRLEILRESVDHHAEAMRRLQSQRIS